MTTRRALLWGLPILCGGLLIFFAVMPPVLQNWEQAFQTIFQKGWTVSVYPQNIKFFSNDMELDKTGRIWVAGEDGVYVFDGAKWINHPGNYTDLAVSPQGEIWAVNNDSGFLHVYDGQQWKTHPFSDFGLGDHYIYQIETDSRGRIWIAVEGGQIAEIIRLEGRLDVRFSYPELNDCHIGSLDADHQGRIWAAVRNPMENVEDCAGLYVLDGETWQRVPDQGMNLQQVVGTAFDDQGRAWVGTACGDVLMYDGKDWTSIVQGDTATEDCFSRPPSLYGITLDSQSRVWAWRYDRVMLLEEGSWITLTEANSPLPPEVISGVAVDGQDRVWIASDDGLFMAAVQDARPLPEKVVYARQGLLLLKDRMYGSIWFLPAVLAILWLAAYLNMLPGVLLAMVLGLLATFLFGPPDMGIYLGHFLPNPGVFATLAGMIGGLLGGWLDRIRLKDGSSKSHLNYFLAIIGLVTGFVLGFFYFYTNLP